MIVMMMAPPAPLLSRRSALVLAGLGAGASMLAACGGAEGAADGGLTVVTSCYPLAFLATRVGGDRVSLIDLTNPGMDSHGLELSVRQVVQVQQRSEEHTSELQSRGHLVCRLLLEKKKL